MKHAFLPLILLAGAPALAVAQTGRVAVAEENFRAAPGGEVVGVVVEGALVHLGESRGRWREATVDGWIWSASVQPRGGARYDLRVSASRGENLRASPNGPLLAHLHPNAVLQRVERRGAWLRVRRTGWLWEPSLRLADSEDASPRRNAGVPARTAEDPPAATASAPAGVLPARPAASGSGARTPPAPLRDERGSGASGPLVRVEGGGVTLRDGAEGDTVGVLRRGAGLEVLATEGDWVRVRVEGWVPADSLEGRGRTDTVVRDLTLAELGRRPEAYRGRLIEWELQFITLERADAVRRDFEEGEPYMLARGPAGESALIYVAVPEARVDDVRRLAPLERVRVRGRLRTPRSALTGAPILDLVQLGAPPPR